MKHLYDELTDFIINKGFNTSDEDINTLYNFVLGNKHQLKDIVIASGDFETFKRWYRQAEEDAKETIEDH